jgi:hypothetical protein
MDEARFNFALRAFLKEVGVTSQREVEKLVRDHSPGRTISVYEWCSHLQTSQRSTTSSNGRSPWVRSTAGTTHPAERVFMPMSVCERAPPRDLCDRASAERRSPAGDWQAPAFDRLMR